MCLYVDEQRHNKNVIGYRRSFVADRPLVIKKRVRTNVTNGGVIVYLSPYYRSNVIQFGVSLKTTLGVRKSVYGSRRMVVEQGFHGFLYSADASTWKNRGTIDTPDSVTIYGVIPVGAKYYVGLDDEVVTDQIMYFKSVAAINKHYKVSKLAPSHRGGYAK